MKISHSGLEKYQMCPKAYKLHYIDKYRPTTVKSSLFFGDALDKSLNALLEGRTDYEKIFIETLSKTKLKEIEVDVPKNPDIIYSNKDCDFDILIQEDFELIKAEFAKTKEDSHNYYIGIAEEKSRVGFENLNLEDKVFFNFMCWISLRRKGILMLSAYKEKILPKIKKVHSVQRMFLKEAGNVHFNGVLDLVAELEGYGTVILDHKTSSYRYDYESSFKKPQLIRYLYFLGEEFQTNKVGYIVFVKNIKKTKVKTCNKCGGDGSSTKHKTCPNEFNGSRCHGSYTETTTPEVDIQLLVKQISNNIQDLTIENTEQLIKSILISKENNCFPGNLNNCSNWYGGDCPYIDLCHKNRLTNLYKKENE